MAVSLPRVFWVQNNGISDALWSQCLEKGLSAPTLGLSIVFKAAYHLRSLGSTSLVERPGLHMQGGHSPLPGTWQCRRCHRCTAHILTAVKNILMRLSVGHNPAPAWNVVCEVQKSPQATFIIQKKKKKILFPSQCINEPRQLTTGF